MRVNGFVYIACKNKHLLLSCIFSERKKFLFLFAGHICSSSSWRSIWPSEWEGVPIFTAYSDENSIVGGWSSLTHSLLITYYSIFSETREKKRKKNWDARRVLISMCVSYIWSCVSLLACLPLAEIPERISTKRKCNLISRLFSGDNKRKYLNKRKFSSEQFFL